MTSPLTKGWGILDNPVPGDVIKALSELGVQMIREVSGEVVVRCPAHQRLTGKEDRHPSCSINLDSGLVNCFSCGWRGTFVVVVQEMLGCNEQVAAAWIKERGSVDRAVRLLGKSKNYIDNLEFEQITEADLAIFDDVPDEYREQRDLRSWSLRSYGVRWDTKKKHWIIPIRDPYTHELKGWQVKGEETRLFKNHPTEVQKSHCVFGSLKQMPGVPLVLVESPLDAVRLDDKMPGIPSPRAISVYGSKVSKAQADWIVLHASSLILALDNDEAGWAGTKEFIEKYAMRVPTRTLYYGHTSAKDIGDMTPMEIRWALEKAYHWSLWTPQGPKITTRRMVRHGSST